MQMESATPKYIYLTALTVTLSKTRGDRNEEGVNNVAQLEACNMSCELIMVIDT